MRGGAAVSHPDALGALLDHLEAALPPRTPLEVATDDLRTTRRALRYLQRSAERMADAVTSTAPYLEERP